MDKTPGWTTSIGISNSTITNGLFPMEEAPTSINPKGTGTCRPFIEVVIPDLIPNAAVVPDKADDVGVDKCEIEDPFEKTKSTSSIYRMHTVKCDYLGQGANDLVPCVHVGEQVIVMHNHGCENGYYWLPCAHQDEGIRLHEHIRKYVMNRSKSIDPDSKTTIVVDDACTYFIDINTNKGDKLIHIHTANNDGEPYGYDIRIIPEQSRFELKDTVGNELSLDSANTIWYMRNINQSFIRLIKEDIDINCSGKLTINAGTIEVTARTTTATTITTHNGMVTTNGNRLTNGNVTVNGTENVSADVIVASKSVKQHMMHG